MENKKGIEKGRGSSVFYLCSLLLLLHVFTGCAQLQRVETQNQGIQKQLDTLNQALDQLNLSQGGATRQIKANLNFLLKDLKEQLNRLHAQLDESQYRFKRLENSIDRLRLLRIEPKETTEKPLKITKKTNVPKPLPSKATPKLDVQKIYHQAREDYITGKYELALKGFQTVYQKDSKGNFKDNALYWAGEIYYKHKNYPKAMEFYTRSIEEYPKGNKKCATLFKIGLLWEDQGDLEKRNQSWKKLQEPACKKSNEALQASELMQIRTL